MSQSVYFCVGALLDGLASLCLALVRALRQAFEDTKAFFGPGMFPTRTKKTTAWVSLVARARRQGPGVLSEVEGSANA